MAAKNIVLCFDGTWNTPGRTADPAEDDSTNVVRFYEMVSKTTDQGREQVKWYNQGVGTEWLNRVRGGAFGLGLDKHIIDGYSKLIETYEEGDDIYLVGFSRGAYTARSLVGLVRNSGLLRTPDKVLMDRAYELYRSRSEVDSEYAMAFRKANSCEVDIRFVGVWDTVGALGLPVESFEDFDAKRYAFHDTKLSSIVQNAYQAIAVDENREPYAPTLWGPQDDKDKAKGQTIEQVWFSGAHADVGGGYKGEHPVSDLTLRWMQKKASNCGLKVESISSPNPDSLISAEIHDSFREFLGGVFSIFSRRYYRPMAQDAGGPQTIDGSVLKRINSRREYRPKNVGLYDLTETDNA